MNSLKPGGLHTAAFIPSANAKCFYLAGAAWGSEDTGVNKAKFLINGSYAFFVGHDFVLFSERMSSFGTRKSVSSHKCVLIVCSVSSDQLLVCAHSVFS